MIIAWARSATPSLAKIAVSAANIAAQNNATNRRFIDASSSSTTCVAAHHAPRTLAPLVRSVAESAAHIGVSDQGLCHPMPQGWLRSFEEANQEEERLIGIGW